MNKEHFRDTRQQIYKCNTDFCSLFQVSNKKMYTFKNYLKHSIKE